MWRLTWRWARASHPNKPTSWVFARYFGKFNKARQDRWVFGDRHTGGYLHRFAWTNIVRHQIVKHRASPDDPALADYWAWRGATHPCRSTPEPSGSTGSRPGAARSAGSASPRRGPATNPTPMGGMAGHHPRDDRHRLGPRHAGQGWTIPSHPPPLQPPPASQQGSLEPDARKRARPVLRRARRRKAPGLPDEAMALIYGRWAGLGSDQLKFGAHINPSLPAARDGAEPGMKVVYPLRRVAPIRGHREAVVDRDALDHEHVVLGLYLASSLHLEPFGMDLDLTRLQRAGERARQSAAGGGHDIVECRRVRRELVQPKRRSAQRPRNGRRTPLDPSQREGTPGAGGRQVARYARGRRS